jgi:hypothetical protein
MVKCGLFSVCSQTPHVQPGKTMGKSIRSKIKRKFRTIKRELIDPLYTERLKVVQEELPLPVRAPDTEESIARRNDPRKKDPRLGCAAFSLAFPGGVTGDDKRRGGVGNAATFPSEALEKKRVLEREEHRIRIEDEERAKDAERKQKLAALRGDKMDCDAIKLKKTIKKKNSSRSEASWKKSN